MTRTRTLYVAKLHVIHSESFKISIFPTSLHSVNTKSKSEKSPIWEHVYVKVKWGKKPTSTFESFL